MSRGIKRRTGGKKSATNFVTQHAYELARSRLALDGMNGADPAFTTVLGQAENAATAVTGMRGLGRGSTTHRGVLAGIVQKAIRVTPDDLRWTQAETTGATQGYAVLLGATALEAIREAEQSPAFEEALR